MKILVVGSGSCEHSIIEKLVQSDLCEKIYCAPGNAGISQKAECIGIPAEDTEALAEFAEKEQIALTLTCSHVPVQHDISGRFESEGLKVFAPSPSDAAFFTREDKKSSFLKKYAFPQNTEKKNTRSVYIIGVSDSSSVICLPPCKFYEKLYDNGEGPLTTGMGAYCPYTFTDKKLFGRISDFIKNDVPRAMKKEGVSYKGLLSFRIEISDSEFFVGDISAHIPGIVLASILPLLESDLLKLILSATDGTLNENMLTFSKRACVCVLIASGGYPSAYKKGFPITFPELKYNVELLHSGTVLKDGVYYTDAGRVLTVRASEQDTQKAREAAYDTISKINFSGMYYRSDIARE